MTFAQSDGRQTMDDLLVFVGRKNFLSDAFAQRWSEKPVCSFSRDLPVRCLRGNKHMQRVCLFRCAHYRAQPRFPSGVHVRFFSFFILIGCIVLVLAFEHANEGEYRRTRERERRRNRIRRPNQGLFLFVCVYICMHTCIPLTVLPRLISS